MVVDEKLNRLERGNMSRQRAREFLNAFWRWNEVFG